MYGVKPRELKADCYRERENGITSKITKDGRWVWKNIRVIQ